MAPDPTPDWITAALAEARTERAPQRLREEIDAMARRPQARSRSGASRRWLLIPVAGLLAAVILVLVLTLPTGAGGPTVAQAAVASSRGGWWSGYPPGRAALTGTSYARFAAVRLPRQLRGTGTWKYSGERVQSLDGRRLLTIFYLHGRHVLIYTIAATPLLRGQRSGFSSFHIHGQSVVSWTESDHSCLLVSDSAGVQQMLKLAKS